MIASLASAVAALAFLGIGAGAAVAPRALSENYGLPVDDPAGFGYVRALGARDAVIGSLILWFAAIRARDSLEATVALGALVGAGDFAIVLRTRGTEAPSSLAIHAGGTVGLLAVWALLRAER